METFTLDRHQKFANNFEELIESSSDDDGSREDENIIMNIFTLQSEKIQTNRIGIIHKIRKLLDKWSVNVCPLVNDIKYPIDLYLSKFHNIDCWIFNTYNLHVPWMSLDGWHNNHNNIDW